MIGYRTLRPEEFDAFVEAMDLAFHVGSTPAKREQTRVLTPFDRTVVAFEGDRIVGTSAAYRQRMSVPGGELPCTGVTAVTVRPTHRRRGILTRMMAGLIEQAQAEREPLASLWAAEGGIYERFGFGVAARRAHVVLAGGSPTPRASLTPRGGGATAAASPAVFDPSAREPAVVPDLIPLAGAEALLAPVWETLRTRRAGVPGRSTDWWRLRVLADADAEPHALPKRLVVVRERTGSIRGYAIHRVKRPGEPVVIEVQELVGVDAEAEAALWGYLCSVDLVETVDAPMRPVDDQAPHRFADFRQPRVVEVADSLWLRLVDVPAALEGRAWSAPLDLTLDVIDARIPDNGGCWRLQVGADGTEARCAPAEDRAPDLVLDVAALGAAYMGGTPAARLHDAGRIAELTPGAVDGLDAALRTPRAPWTPEIF